MRSASELEAHESDILLEYKHSKEKENEKRIRISAALLEDALYKRNPDWIKDRVGIYRSHNIRNVKRLSRVKCVFWFW